MTTVEYLEDIPEPTAADLLELEQHLDDPFDEDEFDEWFDPDSVI